MFFSSVPLSNPWKNKEHPKVNAEDQDHLKDDLPHNGLPQVQCTVYYHSAKLDEYHHQKCLRYLIL